jgi:DNA gyrase subunit A
MGIRLRDGDAVIAASIARDDEDLLVVTENGFGKRTLISQYPVKGRGSMGVKTVQLTEERGQLAGALVVRDGLQVMLMSNGGTVIRIPVEDVKRLGRATQGVIVMRLRGDEQVSTIASVVEQASEEATEAAADAAEAAGAVVQPDDDMDPEAVMDPIGEPGADDLEVVEPDDADDADD